MPLTKRSFCPVCKNTKIKEIFSLPYNSREMINFLSVYYKGRIDIKKLNGKYYKLLECLNCKLIFQEQIPDEKFSQELYEIYIDKDDSLRKKDDYEKKYKKKLFYEMGLIKNIFKKKMKKFLS